MNIDVPRRFEEIYRGNENTHGAWKPKTAKPDANGKIEGKHFTVKGSATTKDILSHLSGNIGLGVCSGRKDGTAGFGAIDVDNYTFGLNDDAGLKALEAKVRELGLPLVVCRTKSGGAHLYLYLTSPTSARIVRRVLNKWAKMLGVQSIEKNTKQTIDCEIFPKQDRLVNDIGGNWINLPYYGNGTTPRYAIHEGKQLSIEQFLDLAESKKQSLEQLAAFLAGDTDIDDDTVGKFNRADALKNGASKGEQNTKLFKLVSSELARGRPYEVAEATACAFGDKSMPPIPHKECSAMVERLYGRYESGAPLTLYNLARALRRGRVPIDTIRKSIKKAAAKLETPFTGDTDKMVERVCEKYPEPETDSPYYIEGTEFYRDVLHGKNIIPKRISKGVIEIIADRRRDDGAEVTREYLLRGTNGKLIIEAPIPASCLNSQDLEKWLQNLLGPKWIVEVNESSHFIAAIKHLSLSPEELRILTMSGWHDGRYLSSAYPDVDLPPQLKPFNIPPPLIGADRIPSIRAALDLLQSWPARSCVPCLSRCVPCRAGDRTGLCDGIRRAHRHLQDRLGGSHSAIFRCWL